MMQCGMRATTAVIMQQKGDSTTSSSRMLRCKQGMLDVSRQFWGCGVGCAFMANLIFSFSALFAKLTGGRVPVLEVCLVRSSVCWLLSIALMATANIRPMFGKQQNLKLLCCRGACGALSLVCYYASLFLLPLGDSVAIGLIGPPITAVAARIFLKEHLGAEGLLGCCISMLGVLVLSHPPFLFGGHEDWGPDRALGTAAGVLSSFLGAASTMIIRTIGRSESAAVIGIWFHTGTILTSSIPLAVGFPVKGQLLSPRDAGLMLGMAGTSFVAQLMNTHGLQLIPAAKAAAIGFTGVPYSFILGAIFFHEKISLMGVLGVLLILLGVLLVTFKPQKDSAAGLCPGEADMMPPLSASAPNKYSNWMADEAELLLKDSGYIPSEFLALHATTAAHPESDAAVTVVTASAAYRQLSDGTSIQKPAAKTAAAPADGGVAPVTGDSLPSVSGWHNLGSSVFAGTTASAAGGCPHASPFQQAAAGFFISGPSLEDMAAEAASAFAGELCPAATAAIAASRQASARSAVRGASIQVSTQASRHGSIKTSMSGQELSSIGAVKTDAELSRQSSPCMGCQAQAVVRAKSCQPSRQPSGSWFENSLVSTVAASILDSPRPQQQNLTDSLLSSQPPTVD